MQYEIHTCIYLCVVVRPISLTEILHCAKHPLIVLILIWFMLPSHISSCYRKKKYLNLFFLSLEGGMLLIRYQPAWACLLSTRHICRLRLHDTEKAPNNFFCSFQAFPPTSSSKKAINACNWGDCRVGRGISCYAVSENRECCWCLRGKEGFLGGKELLRKPP